MAVIEVAKGKEKEIVKVLIDDDKLDDLKQYKWYINSNGYAFRLIKIRYNKHTSISMHRQITNCPEGLVVDHINGNRLDNRTENLEIVTQEENMRRRRGKPRDLSHPFYSQSIAQKYRDYLAKQV